MKTKERSDRVFLSIFEEIVNNYSFSNVMKHKQTKILIRRYENPKGVLSAQKKLKILDHLAK